MFRFYFTAKLKQSILKINFILNKYFIFLTDYLLNIIKIEFLSTVVDFFNRINLIYGTVSEYCDSATCPTMSGGARFEYLWADGEKYRKPTALPAPQYVNLLMDWTENQINNENVFPVSTGNILCFKIEPSDIYTRISKFFFFLSL